MRRDGFSHGQYWLAHRLVTLQLIRRAVRRRHALLSVVGVPTAFVLACGTAVGPSEANTGDIQLRLVVSPEVVRPAAAFLAHVVVQNVSSHTVTLTSGASCLGWAGVYRGERQNNFPGTDYYCLAVTTGIAIAAGDSTWIDLDVRAGTTENPAAAGGYVFRFDFAVMPELPSLEHSFVVE